MSAAIEQRNQEATCYIGNLDEQVNEELLWELMLQCGPVVNVHMPKDKVSNSFLGYGFVEYRSELDADYAIKIMNMIKVYGKPIKVNKASQNKRISDIGANIFIGNLDPDVDEKLLYDTFSAFGGILSSPKVMRDAETNISKGFGFVSYDSFEASDLAIECMNGQYLCNRRIQVQYAFKKDSSGERHGSQAERMLAASKTEEAKLRPHSHFAGGIGEGVQTLGGEAGPNMLTAPTASGGPPAVAAAQVPMPMLSGIMPGTAPVGGMMPPTPHSMDPNAIYQMQMQQQPHMHPFPGVPMYPMGMAPPAQVHTMPGGYGAPVVPPPPTGGAGYPAPGLPGVPPPPPAQPPAAGFIPPPPPPRTDRKSVV